MDALVNFSLEWPVPFVVSGVYAATVAFWNKSNLARPLSKSAAAEPAKKKRSVFDMLVLLHNFALMAYSLWTFVSVVPILYRNYTRLPVMEAFCDARGILWRQGLQYYTNLFYLSKYYEIVDTIIILLKGKQSSFLQTFHHTGAILVMFLLCKYEAKGAFVFVTCNSFIHSVMYCYYLLTGLGYRPSWKQLLTRMQIGQFLFGMSLGSLFLFYPSCIDTSKQPGKGQFVAVLINLVYVCALVVLFNNFAKRTYGPQQTKRE